MWQSNFIGQKFVIERCMAIINSGEGYNILLRGWWGSGKTTLAKALPDMGTDIHSYTFQIAPVKPEFDPDRHIADVHIVDEAHRIKGFESFYGWMQRHNFIFTSNMASKIPEPFLSRCYVFRLREYSLDDLTRIIMVHSNLPKPLAKLIAKRSRGIPRVGVVIAEKTEYLIDDRGLKPTENSVLRVLEEMGIDESGLDQLDRKLLKALETGPKSARNLQAILAVDADELRRMERFLLQQGLINITSKGRELT